MLLLLLGESLHGGFISSETFPPSFPASRVYKYIYPPHRRLWSVFRPKLPLFWLNISRGFLPCHKRRPHNPSENNARQFDCIIKGRARQFHLKKPSHPCFTRNNNIKRCMQRYYVRQLFPTVSLGCCIHAYAGDPPTELQQRQKEEEERIESDNIESDHCSFMLVEQSVSSQRREPEGWKRASAEGMEWPTALIKLKTFQ